MRVNRFTYVLAAMVLSISACNLTSNNSIATEVELVNQTGEILYYLILDEETASLVDISPIIDLEVIPFPSLMVNESVVVDLKEIEGFPVEKLDQGIHIILYTIRDNYMDYPRPVAVGRPYGNISYNELKNNQYKVVLRTDN